MNPTARPSRVALSLLLVAGLAAPAAAQRQTCAWQAQTPANIPEARAAGRLVFDSSRARAVLHGGTLGTLFTSTRPDTTWEWNGADWTLASPGAPPGPGGRMYQAMVFDPIRNVTLLHGGSGGDPIANQNDTWTWNGTAWTQLTPAGPIPSVRNAAAITFDTARGVAILFGGLASPNRLNDTWEWNGTAWTQRSPGGGAGDPAPRHFAAMAYDPIRNETVLFGGNIQSGHAGDMWTWDGTAGTWTQRTIPAPPAGPRARSQAGMTWDSARQVIVMHAGMQPGVTGNTDLWQWDGAAWTEITLDPPDTPSGRYNAPIVHDPIRNTILLFGGHIPTPPTSPSTSQETWTLSCGGGPAPCYPNCDDSTQAPVLNVADFGCFLTRYAAGDPYANCDESTQPPVLNVADFGCFLTKYAAGCR